MAKRPLDDAERYDYRVGKGGFAFGGMMQDPDPGANPPNRPRLIVNGRFQGGGLVSRPPYIPKVWIGPNLKYSYQDPTLQTTSSSAWQPKWMGVHNPQVNNELWSGDFSATDGARVRRGTFDGDPSSPVVGNFPSLIVRANPVARWQGDIYVGDQGHFKKIYRSAGDGEGGAAALGSLPQDETLYTFANSGGSARHVSVLFPHSDGKLYMQVDDAQAIADTKIYSYDGTHMVEEYDLGASYASGGAFSSVNGKLGACFYEGATGSLYLKDTDGSWGTVAPTGAAAFPNDFQFEGWINGMATIGNKIYIGCGGNGWWVYNDLTGVLSKYRAAPHANVCVTLGERIYLCEGGVSGAASNLQIQDEDGITFSSVDVVSGVVGRFTYPTAISAVGRRLQLTGYYEVVAGGQKYPYSVSYGTPGAPIEAGLSITIPIDNPEYHTIV